MRNLVPRSRSFQDLFGDRRDLDRVFGRVSSGGTFDKAPPSATSAASLPATGSLGFRAGLSKGPSGTSGTVSSYYQEASALRVAGQIRVPTLIVTAQDDPFIPFESFHHPAIVGNRSITLMAPEHGGHCAFISRNGGRERFWAESRVVEFCAEHSEIVGFG